MQKKNENKQSSEKYLRIVIVFLESVGFVILLYLLVLPIYPKIIYKLFYQKNIKVEEAQNVEVAKKELQDLRNSFPESDYSVSKNRLIISKIGVNAPIIESKSEQYGLSKGSWRVPESSTPDRGGNTVLTGHRFKYLPPNNLTFYLFNELAKGDLVSLIWDNKDYIYRIRETKIVAATELSIMNRSDDSILTMFTCDPIYSTKNRLVVIADLLEQR